MNSNKYEDLYPRLSLKIMTSKNLKNNLKLYDIIFMKIKKGVG